MSTFLSMAAWAQQEKGTWSILPKIGLNMAGIVTYDHDTDVDGESYLRYAPIFGFEAEYQLTKKVALVGKRKQEHYKSRESSYCMGETIHIIFYKSDSREKGINKSF